MKKASLYDGHWKLGIDWRLPAKHRNYESDQLSKRALFLSILNILGNFSYFRTAASTFSRHWIPKLYRKSLRDGHKNHRHEWLYLGASRCTMMFSTLCSTRLRPSPQWSQKLKRFLSCNFCSDLFNQKLHISNVWILTQHIYYDLSYSLALVNSIPPWLVWVEIKFIVHIAHKTVQQSRQQALRA